MAAKAQIVSINLPSELSAGESISGNIYVKNVGDSEGVFRLLVTTLWDGKQYLGQGTAGVGETIDFYIPPGLITMPNQDASIRFDAMHQAPDGNFVTDDSKTH